MRVKQKRTEMCASSFSSRITEERERLGLGVSEMASVGGVHRNAQGRYEAGASSPGAEYLSEIARAGADVQYLLTGVRSTGELTEDEAAVLACYRGMDEEGKKHARAVVEALALRNRQTPGRS